MERKFYIAGVKFHDLPSYIKDLEVGTKLSLESESTNPFDPNAVKIFWGDIFCGYVPKKFSAEVSAMVGIEEGVQCEVIQVNVSAKTWEMCKVKVFIEGEEEEEEEEKEEF